MMNITNRESLDSLLREAGRQASFYHTRHNNDLCSFWSEIESLTFAAKTSNQALTIRVESSCTPSIIKAGEQVQQLRK